jgi:hypothetical protein
MKKNAFLRRFFLVSVAVLAATLMSVSVAHATWQWVHGHNGHIEFKDRYADANRCELGWGLDFTLNSGTWNWIHFAVPTIASPTQGVRYVKVRFYTGSVDAWVSAIHIYDGTAKVKVLEGAWSNGYKTVVVDLGSVRSFTYGLGVSVEIKAGVEPMSHRFIFVGAGANFVPK